MIYTYTVALGIPYLQTDPAERRIFLDVVPCFWASKSRLVEPTNVAHLVYMLRDVVWCRLKGGKKGKHLGPQFQPKIAMSLPTWQWSFLHNKWIQMVGNEDTTTSFWFFGGPCIHFPSNLTFSARKQQKSVWPSWTSWSSGFHQYFNWRCTQNTTRDPFKWPKILFCFFNLFSWSKSLLSTSVCEIVQLRASCWGFHHFGFRADYICHVPRGRPFD